MDPSETLRQIRELSSRIPKHRTSPEALMVELFEALDEWIMKGGFLPEEWQQAQRRNH